MTAKESRQAKIGLIQVSSGYNWSVEQCLEEMLMLSERCLQDGADLVFMPEAYQYKGVKQVSIKARAIDNSVFVAPCQLHSKRDVTYTGMIDLVAM